MRKGRKDSSLDLGITNSRCFMIRRFLLPICFLLSLTSESILAQSSNKGFRLDTIREPSQKSEQHWFVYTDENERGLSKANKEYVIDSSRFGKVYRLSYTLNQGSFRWSPFVGLGCNTSNMDVPKDSKAISYAYKGAAHAILFRGSGVADFGYYQYPLTASKSWKVVTIPFSQLRQPGWAKTVPFQPETMEGWSWHVTGNTHDKGTLSIDNIQLLNEPQTSQYLANMPKEDPSQSLESVERLHSVVVLKDNKVLFRKFFNGYSPNSPTHIFSEVKSLLAVLIGIAIDKGFITSVDQPLSDFFPVILADTSRYKKKITLRHLLNHTSGLPAFEWPNNEKWINATNPCLFLLSQPLVSIPGETFQYNSAGTHLLSAVITKATKLPAARFADKYLLLPLGITNYRWETFNDGYNDGAGATVQFKTDDMVKIGTLLLDHGLWNGQRIVSEQWLKQLFPDTYTLKAPWGLKDSNYNLCWYEVVYKNVRIDYANGYAGQYLFLIPSLKAMIVVHHNHESPDNNRQSFLFLMNQFPMLFDQVLEANKK